MAKMRTSRLVSVLVLTLAAFGLSAATVAANGPSHPAAAPSVQEEPQVVRIGITDKGPDPGALQVKLEQGRPVEIKFEYKQTFHDAHVFDLEGFGLKTEELSAARPEVSIKFVPTQLGTAIFFCSIECEIHHLLDNIRLTVVAPGGGGAGPVVERPTSLTLASLQQTSKGEPVTLWATLRDADGKPVAGSEVRFFVGTELFPDRPMLAGSAVTDSGGAAKLVFTPRVNGQVTFQAKFEGGGIYKTSEASYALSVTGAHAAYDVEPRGLEAVARWAPPVVAGVLAVIWSTYAFVVYQVVRVARSKGEAH